MSEADKQGSIFQEMAERRSRNEDLTAKAVEQGLEVHDLVLSIEATAEEGLDAAFAPAFEMEEETPATVSENEIRIEEPPPVVEGGEMGSRVIDNPPVMEELSPVDSNSFDRLDQSDFSKPEVSAESDLGVEAPPSGPVVDEKESFDGLAAKAPPSYFDKFTEPATDPVPEAVDELEAAPAMELESSVEESPVAESAETAEVHSSYFDDIGGPEGEVPVAEEQEQEAAAELETEEEVELHPLAAEDLIEQSDDLLASPPEPIADAEVLMAAEEIVDRIGPVVDIQSLPKTQPSRVLSKTTKAKPEKPVVESDRPAQVEQEPAAAKKTDEIVSKLVEDAPTQKKKKKKVTLLDSYFKGL